MGRVLLQPLGHLVGHQAFQRLAHLGRDELVLGLRRELRVGQLHRDDRGQPLAHVVAGERHLLLLQHPRFLGIVVQRARQRRAERGDVRAAVALGDVVGEGEDVLVIAVVPLERDLDRHVVAAAHHADRLGEQRLLGAIEVFDERGDPALVIELDRPLLLMPRVRQEQPDAGVQERELAIAVLELVEVELGDLEGGGRGQEGDARTLLPGLGDADDLQRQHGVAMGEAHIMLLAVAPDRQVQPFAERIDHRHADAVQPARHLVGVGVIGVVELAARMELRHDDLGRRHALARMDAGRDAAAIVGDADRPVGVQADVDPVAMPGQRLVDRIVGDLEHHVVQARPVVGIADIHARPLAHRVQALEHLDRGGVVVVVRGFRHP